LQSKRGALHELGEEFPKEKLAEIFAEQMEEAKDQGALQLLNTSIAQAVTAVTGMVPGPDGSAEPLPPPPAPNADGTTPPAPAVPQISPDVANLAAGLVERAYMPKLGMLRVPSSDDD
jgi:hypothetical protein